MSPLDYIKLKRRNRRNERAKKIAQYTQGFNDASVKYIKDIKFLTDKLTVTTKENIEYNKNFQNTYNQNIEKLTRDWENKCDVCKKNIKIEKDRAKVLQTDLKNSIDRFQELINKLMSLASLTRASAESAAKLVTLQSQLNSLSLEAQIFLENNKKMLNIDL